MTRIQQRLQALEQVAVAAPMLGFRYFQQGGADPDIYKESATGQALTLGEIDALSAAGWRCIVVGWDMPEDRRGVRLTWGDEQPAAG